MAIDTREELINALQQACEIEHALLVQYLYAGLSMKKALTEGLTAQQQALARQWQGRIFLIAREEMGHLGIVCNLLAAIGAPVSLDRPAMPRAVGYYPFPFSLLPFGDEALYQFLVFELPRGFPLPPPPGADLRAGPALARAVIAPEPLTYKFIGELYASIAQGFEVIQEKQLFVGPPEAQTDNADWSDSALDIRMVTNRATALEAINNIVIDGEGTPDNRKESHYNTFLDIRQAYFDQQRFEAARPIPRNPATRANPRADGTVTLIQHPFSLKLAELFNISYGVMLLLLQHYFSLVGRPDDPAAAARRALQTASQRFMSVAIRPLAEELTRAPLADPASPHRAGPSFEIYSDVRLSPYPAARWTILFERLDAVIAACAEVGRDAPRVAEIGQTLAIMRKDLADTSKGLA